MDVQRDVPGLVVNFERRYKIKHQSTETTFECCKKNFMKCCSIRQIKRGFIASFPFIQLIKNYKLRKYLANDIIAGMTVGIMQIPQGKTC